MALSAEAFRGLQCVDSDWALIPVDGNKRPVDPATGNPANNWAATTYDLDGITALARASMHVQAVGVVLGAASGGLLALDLDGPAAGPTFQQVYSRPVSDLPHTVGWSSGLTKRAQLGFLVAREHWPYLRGRRRWKHDGKTSLELRWAGHQSVIAGAHPDTSGYTWLDGRSPADVNTAEAPDWLLEPLFRAPDEPIQAEYRPTAADAGRALDILSHIKARDDYDGWLAAGMALHSVDPGLLTAWVEWSQGSKNFNEEECLQKWASFKGSGRTIGTLYWLAREDGYTGPKHPDPIELLKRPASFSAQADDEHPQGDEDLEYAAEKLQEQLRNLRTTIDLRLILPSHLADRLITRAGAFPVDPSALLGPLLTAAASIVGTRVTAVVNKSWSEPMVIWAGNVLPPSALKSPVTKVVESPLLDLQQAAFKAHRDAVTNRAEGEPEPPPARRFVVMDSTYERIAQILSEPTTCGLLSLQDELGGWFERLDASSSAGARAGWLSLWSGSAALIDRKVAASSFARYTAVSLFGNVQPERLAQMVNAGDDEAGSAGDGLWARFLWCRPPQIPWTYNPDGRSIHREIAALLQTLNTVPHGADAKGMEVRFPHEVVDQLARPEWERWARLAADESNGARAAFLGKLRGYSVRLAALLELINQAETCGIFSQSMQHAARVDSETGQWFIDLPAAAMIAGLTLSEFYLAQFDALQPEVGGGDLPPLVAKFLRKVEESGCTEVSVRDLQRWRLKGRESMDRETALGFLRSVAESYGYGRIEAGKRKGQWLWLL
jgi:hypothetical protein